MAALRMVLGAALFAAVLALAGASANATADGGACDALAPECEQLPKHTYHNMAIEPVAEQRRRTFRPAEPLGPGAPEAAAVDPNLRIHVVVRGTVGARLADSLAVQGVDTVRVLPAGTDMASSAFAAALADLDLAANTSAVLFLDDPSATLFLGELQEISRKFQRSSARVLLAAALKCRRGCAFDWPAVGRGQAQYLDGSALMAYSGDFTAMVQRMPPQSGKVVVSDMHHIAAFFLADGDRNELGLKLDSLSDVFLSLSGHDDSFDPQTIELDFTYRGVNDTRLYLVPTNVHPSIVVGGNNPKLLSQINNYAPMRFHPDLGCLHCHNSSDVDAAEAHVYVGVFVEDATPFLDLFLESLTQQTLAAAGRMTVGVTIFAGPSAERHAATVQEWLSSPATATLATASLVGTNMAPFDARRAIYLAANASAATHLFSLDATVHLEEPTALAHLVNERRSVLAPIVTQHASAFSNTWGASDGDPDSKCRDTHTNCAEWAATNECELSATWMRRNCPVSCDLCVGASSDVADFAYRRSFDYMRIVAGTRRGVWEMPFVHMAVLLDRAALGLVAASMAATAELAPEVTHYELSVSVAWMLRARGIELQADNQVTWGLMASTVEYIPSKVHPDLFTATTNEPLWRRKYLHPEYNATRQLNFVEDRCWDIYNFPLFSDRFCNDFINESEACGQWSGGQSTDKRLKGGYEPVPTRDIHFNQYGFDKTWRFILRNFVAPVAQTQWVGYKLEGTHTLDFIVKYQPEGQPFLRPHHDASTFSINVALNRINVDFEGGGTHFQRQNCTVLSNKMGHALIHPGRLTHQHEGLYVTKGTRYIIVSFVDQV